MRLSLLFILPLLCATNPLPLSTAATGGDLPERALKSIEGTYDQPIHLTPEFSCLVEVLFIVVAGGRGRGGEESNDIACLFVILCVVAKHSCPSHPDAQSPSAVIGSGCVVKTHDQ